MKQFLKFFIFIAIIIQCIVGITLFKSSNVTTPYLIMEAGYPMEEHKVTTKDGYILTLHRIPHSPRNIRKKLPVAFLQHGLVASSVEWIGLGPPDALGYLLSEEGFDIWLGNSRGNRYSLKHVEISSKSPRYWNFSWHELGIYDLPAVFDYISKVTGVDQLQYIGHSQGATELVVYCSTDPSCSKRIKAAHLLAPVVFLNNARVPFIKMFALLFGQPNPFANIFGSINVVPTEFITNVVNRYCNDNSPFQPVCIKMINYIMGPRTHSNKSMATFLASIYSAGASFKQIQHYLQCFNSGKFREFDYGRFENLKLYGSIKPPDYKLKNFLVPTYLYYSENDVFATPKDVLYFISHLNDGVVRSSYLVPDKKWNHSDFLIGKNVKKILYDEVLKNIRKSERGL